MIPLYRPQIFVVDFWGKGLTDGEAREAYLKTTLSERKLLGSEFLYTVADGDKLVDSLAHIGIPRDDIPKRIHAVDTENLRWYEPLKRGIEDMIRRHEVATLVILDKHSFVKKGSGYELIEFDDPESVIRGITQFQF